jgi:hypothetical protein
VKTLARYPELAGSTRGYIVAATAEPKSNYTWPADWMDICSFDVVAAVEVPMAAQIQGARK